MKRVFVLLLVGVLCVTLCACGVANSEKITIPDIEELDVETAKTLLAGKGLIPKIEYEYHNDYEYDAVIRTEPVIGNKVEEDSPVTLFVCKGPKYHALPNALAAIYDIEGVEDFIAWYEADDGIGTKGFETPYLQEGYLYFPMFLKCTSNKELEFYGDFGSASINDTFDKTVPIDVIYDSKSVDNRGEKTEFTFKVPLSDLGEKRPTNLYITVWFSVGGERKALRVDFELTW